MGVNVEIGKRLRSFRQNKNLTQVELATAAGRSKQLVSAWEAGRAEITIESVTRLARSVGLDPRWLLMGDRGTGDKVISDRTSGKEAHRDALIGTRMPFRTIEQIARAGTAEAVQQATDTVVTTYHDYPAGCFAMPCPDGSLHPTIRAADLLIIDPTALPRPGQWVAAAIFAEKEVQLSEPAIVLRRIHFQSVRGLNGPVALVADAPGWPTFLVRLGADARLAGTVVGFEGKIVSDTERMAGVVPGKHRIHAG